MSFPFRKNHLLNDSDDEVPPLDKKASPQPPEKLPLLLPQAKKFSKDDLQMPIKVQEAAKINLRLIKQAKTVYHAQPTNPNDIYEESESNIEIANLSADNIKHEQQLQPNPHKMNKLATFVSSPIAPNISSFKPYNILNSSNSQEDSEVKQEANPENSSIILHSQSLADEEEWKKRMKERNALLCLMNSFKAFQQATYISLNHIKLAKRDSLNKVYSSILNVLSKQNTKMASQLEKLNGKVTNSLQKLAIKRKVKLEQNQPSQPYKSLPTTGISEQKMGAKSGMIDQGLPKKLK